MPCCFCPISSAILLQYVVKMILYFLEDVARDGRKQQRPTVDLEGLNKYEDNTESKHDHLNAPFLKGLAIDHLSES